MPNPSVFIDNSAIPVLSGPAMTKEQAAALREPFPPSAIGKLPRAGTTLDYVGHAAVTDRLLHVDRYWTWEPVAWAENGTPLWTVDAGNAVLWIRLTVCGVSRLGVGICKANAFELEKQLISDALRNAAMRFGVALDLWSREDLESSGPNGASVSQRSPVGPESSGSVEARSSLASPGSEADVEGHNPSVIPASATRDGSAGTTPPGDSAGPPATPLTVAVEYWSPGKSSLKTATSRCSALAAIGVDIKKERDAVKLPTLAKLRDEADWLKWQRLLADLETAADKEAERAGAVS